MSLPPQLDLGPDPQPAAAAPAPQKDNNIAPVWLQRMSLVMLVVFCLVVGVMVVVVPWWPRIWDQNPWLLAHPQVAAVLRNGAVRGFITGVGLLDIWIGLSEAVHYRDYRG